MAARKKTRPRSSPPPTEQLVWGMPVEKWREVSFFCLSALALLLLLALISDGLERRWIGTLGDALAGAVGFVFGGWVAYVLPILLLLAAVHAFRGRTPVHPLRKTAAGVMILLALCALSSLRYNLDPTDGSSELSLLSGGVIGSFLTSDATFALNLGRLLGPAGAYLVCFGMLVVGIMLSTDFLFVPLIRRVAGMTRSGASKLRRPLPVATLHFDRDRTFRVFPTITPLGPVSETTVKQLDLDAILQEDPKDQEQAVTADAQDPSAQLEIRNATEAPAPRAELEHQPTLSEMIQTELDFTLSDFEVPTMEILSTPDTTGVPMDREEVLEISGQLEKALADFSISARVVAVTQGPVVTQYELQPAPGVKVSRILSLENDIALVLRAKSVRIQAPIPGKAAIGIEVPNRKVTPVYFRDLVGSDEFRSHESALAFALGKNISGEPVICDLATMPHLLIAGTTGSGKSVCVNAIISSILFRMPPDRAKFIMIDPKRVELNVYSDIPHLLAPVVNEPRQAASALMWAVQQMEQRLELFSRLRVRNIDSYNAVASGKRKTSKTRKTDDLHPMPHIVIIIDELADLMLIAKNEVEEFIVRLAQMSRAAGIHMIIATQRPSVNVLTGIIKANFPSRIAFRVSAKVDSRTILDMNGAETLLGSGDMLFSPGGTKPMRIQGAFIGDQDVERLTDYLRAQTPAAYEKEEFSAADLARAQAHDFERNHPGGEQEEAGGDSGTPSDLAVDKEPDPVKIPTEASVPSRRPGAGKAQVEFPEMQLKGEVNEDEVLYDKALRLVLETRKPSVSMIQRRLKVGFARAGRLMDLMEERHVVGPYLGSKPRDLIVEDPDALLRRMDEANGT